MGITLSDNTDLAVEFLLSSVLANPSCVWEPVLGQRLVMRHSGTFEALALLCSREGAWYGHAVEIAPGEVAAMLVWADVSGDGPIAESIEAFRRDVVEAGAWHPCAVQADDDAYGVFRSPSEAFAGLTEMVKRFDPAKRWPEEGGPYADSRLELRIAGLYGLADLPAKAA